MSISDMKERDALEALHRWQQELTARVVKLEMERDEAIESKSATEYDHWPGLEEARRDLLQVIGVLRHWRLEG